MCEVDLTFVTRLDHQTAASTRKTATKEIGGEAVLILTLLLGSLCSDNVKTRNLK